MTPVDVAKSIPVGVWDQLAVVLVFVVTLGTLGYWMVRKFTDAISDINAHYGKIISDSNVSWQRYFDARMEATAMVNSETITKLAELSEAVRELRRDFDAHDQWERQTQDTSRVPLRNRTSR